MVNYSTIFPRKLFRDKKNEAVEIHDHLCSEQIWYKQEKENDEHPLPEYWHRVTVVGYPMRNSSTALPRDRF